MKNQERLTEYGDIRLEKKGFASKWVHQIRK